MAPQRRREERPAAAPSREALVAAFRLQARGCAQSGSPIYAELLARAAEDLEVGGVFADVLADYRGEPILDALPLRVFGAIHEKVLAGAAPALAAHYPSAGGRFDAEPAWRALRELVVAARDELRAAAATGRVQTNEVRRCTALLAGFLRIAQATGLPLRVREIGSSAGLNLGFDRFRYRLGPHVWGAPSSAVELRCDWQGPAPDLTAPLRVASRAGCDVAPIDVRDPAQERRLESFVWPDQHERLATLRAAIAATRDDPPPLTAQRAQTFVARELVAPVARETSVLFHSVVWWYLPESEREQISATIAAAGTRAGAAAPLAWLRLEGVRLEDAELRLTLWPGGEDHLLARVHWHGRWVHWSG
jgi:hypothetical protein